jgi:hypothetical protein
MCGAGFTGPLKALFQSRAYLRRLALAIMLFACQNGTGINAINYVSGSPYEIFHAIYTGLLSRRSAQTQGRPMHAMICRFYLFYRGCGTTPNFFSRYRIVVPKWEKRCYVL